MPECERNMAMSAEKYRIVYTESAQLDIEEKADYISFVLREGRIGNNWYLRLRQEVREKLSLFPRKYPVFRRYEGTLEIRQYVCRNDVILYSVDEDCRAVYIWAITTKGRDLDSFLSKRL